MMRLVSGVRRVNAIGHAEPLTDYPLMAMRLHLEAIPANTDLVYVGGPETHAGQPAGSSLMGDATNKKPGGFVFDNVDLQNVYVDALVADEGVSWMAEVDG